MSYNDELSLLEEDNILDIIQEAPGDEEGYLGYYDTRYEKMVKKQVELARSHGIYGFGIFYYWFSGKRFLDETIDLFLESKKIKS